MTAASPPSLAFTLAPDDVAAFEALAFDSEAFAGGRPHVGESADTWLDTRNGDLGAGELALCVEGKGRRRTLRPLLWPDIAVPDWRPTPFAGGAPPLDALPKEFLDILGDVPSPAELGSVFTRTLAWRERVAVSDQASIVLRLEQGEVSARPGVVPLLRARLELRTGRVADLFAFARNLRQRAPMRLCLPSSARIGFLVAAEQWGKPGVKTASRVTFDMNAAEACAEVLESCLLRVSMEASCLGRGEDVEAIHQTRVAIRRLRAAFALFKPILSDAEFDRLRGELVWLFRLFGEARDIDVAIERHDAAGGPDRGSESARWRAEAMTKSTAARDAIKAALASPRFDDLMFDMAAFIRAGAWRRARDPAHTQRRGLAIERFAAKRFDRRQNELADLVERYQELGPEGLHDLRKRAKTLRYLRDFLEPLARGSKARGRFEKGSRSLAELQDTLGLVHDIDAQASAESAVAPPPLDQNRDQADREELVKRGKRVAKRAARAKPFLDV